MNFFEHQDRARQNTFYLLGLFCVAVFCIIIFLYIPIAWAIFERLTWNPEVFAVVSAGTIVSIGGGSIHKLLALRAGGKVVAEDLGGKLVSQTTENEKEQQLLNIVEEMSIASGVAIPAVYTLDTEEGINAFAAGFTPNDAVIGVTQGCLEQLSRDELQGVIAHEFSHILNGDMRLNLRLIGILQGLLLIHIMGRYLLNNTRSSGSKNKDENSGFLIFLAMYIIGYIGFFCGRLIKSAISRQREFLADASSVQFTRNPVGIANALRKIGEYKSGSEMEAPQAEEASHMFFGEALKSFARELSTHPSLEERISRLDNLGDRVSSVPTNTQPSVPLSPTEEPVLGFADSSSKPPKIDKLSVNPDRVVPGVGTTNSQHLEHAQAFIAKLPEEVRMAIKEPSGAMAVVYSLLFDSDKEASDRQFALLQESEPSEVMEMVSKVIPHLEQLDARSRLPLIDLTITALRNGSAKQCTRFLKQVKALIDEDNHLTLSEYAVFVVLSHRLTPYFFAKRQDQSIQFTQMKQIWPDCIILLSALAQVGHNSPDLIAYAFRSGLFRLPGGTSQTLPKEPVNYTLAQVGESLKCLELATPKLKQSVVDACAYTVLVDRKVTLEEAELLRAIVISLNCPIPPFLE
ncbi:MAG: M48 family metallopeptidase [Trichodesmium sp.]